MKSGFLEIYSTDDGAVVVKNPVKLGILRSLKASGASFDGIVSAVGRSKATVSVHLSDLKAENLIAEREFKGDRRKKVFYLTGRFIVAAASTNPAVRYFVRNEVSRSIGDPFTFMASLFRTVRYSLEASGLNTDPAIKAAGFEVGSEVAKTFSSTDERGLAGEIVGFWRAHKLGRMELSKKSPLTFRVRDCVSSRNSPKFGKSMCALTEGLLESVFYGRLGRECSVEETACYGTGRQYCEFVVRFKP